MQIAVLGSGSWGTALSILLARNGHQVQLLGRNREEIAEMQSHRENRHYLPGFQFPDNLVCLPLHDGIPLAEMAVIAVPSDAVREMAKELPTETGLVVVAAKGLEAGTAKLLVDVVAEERPSSELSVLSGPNLAVEIARQIPTVAVAASRNSSSASEVAAAFLTPMFRVSPSSDVIGVEIAGALKNVLAIGAGMSDGLGYGDNTKGAFLSRGLVDLAKLGVAMGGKMETFLGPAGVGDLFATAVSRLSRNYRFGRAIGEGKLFADALAEIGQVVEGISSCESAIVLGDRHGLELPVLRTIHQVMHHHMTPSEAVGQLMARPVRSV
jgi:glycerol-3-phosphate dehydrogenase (NAD(P)+)